MPIRFAVQVLKTAGLLRADDKLSASALPGSSAVTTAAALADPHWQASGWAASTVCRASVRQAWGGFEKGAADSVTPGVPRNGKLQQTLRHFKAPMPTCMQRHLPSMGGTAGAGKIFDLTAKPPAMLVARQFQPRQHLNKSSP